MHMAYFFVTLVAFVGAAHAWVPRPTADLNGSWEMARTPAAVQAPPGEGWTPVQVPGLVTGFRYEAAWWRRSFDAPAAWAGKRVKMVLQGARFCPVLYVNGQKVGEHFGGYEPCEFDITAAVRPGEPNEVMIHATDWTALFRGDPVEFPVRVEWNALRSVPRDRVVYPIGGRYNYFGPWDDVVAYAVPDAHVRDAFIITDVGKKRLTVYYELVNQSDQSVEVTLSASVMDGSVQMLVLPSKKVTLAPGGRMQKLELSAEWPTDKVKLWSPESPKLYLLETRLQGPSSQDRRADRFGFRQFTVKGHEFFLNGVRRHLLATSTWPLAATTHDEVAEVLRSIKKANCVAFRTHTQPWRQIWYDVADEIGLMMVPEGAVWNDDTTYRLDDPKFWQNWGDHLVGMVRALRNHPSVVLWSLENEFFGTRATAGSPYEKRLADLGRLVKRTDATRPIMYESDGDPGGVADVVGIHYPHEPPSYREWPTEAYWMDEPRKIGSGRMFWPTEEFQWDRKKPLYIGEYLWWPEDTPEGYTLICGDEAYISIDNARRLAKARVWRWQTVAYRHYEVSGICPWTLFEGGPLTLEDNPMMAGQAYAMQPLAAYVREETRRAYSGAKVTRHLEIFNDTPEPVRGTLGWELSAGGKALAEGGLGIDLQPGEHRDQEVSFVAPAVTGIADGVFRLVIEQAGRVRFRDERPFVVFGRVRLRKPEVPVYLYDPVGATARLLGEQGVSFRSVASLSGFVGEAGSVLIVGEGGLAARADEDPWGTLAQAKALQRYVASGGRVIVLQQKAYPAALLPVRLDSRVRSTMAFLQMPGHELLKGLPEDAFSFWQPDHIVTEGELVRPTQGGWKSLVVAGHPDGISRCALMEGARGKGLYLLCQMPLVARFGEEPLAAELLNRLLLRAAGYSGEATQVLVAGGDSSYHQALEDTGVSYRRDALDAAALGQVHVALLAPGGQADLAALAQWVRHGGNLLVDRPTSELVTAVGDWAAMKLSVDPFTGPAGRSEGDDPLVQAITREDLYWIGERMPGPSWQTQPVAGDVAEGAVGLDVEFEPLQSFGPGDMEVEGGIVRRETEQVLMATVGSAWVVFRAPEDGEYLLSIEARGTKCQEVYALAAVIVDGKAVGHLSTTADWQSRTMPVRLTAGEHRIEVRFVNDANMPPEDRNFMLRSVKVGRGTGELPPIVRIAQGPSVAAVVVGKGRVVLNFLKWNTEERNVTKARRFFGALLTELGAEFTDQIGIWYDVAQFTPMEGLAHYYARDGQASLGSSGWIEGEIWVPQASDYLLSVQARGTKAADEYPEVVVFVDDREVGRFHLTSESWRRYVLRTSLERGPHRLRLLFTNDYYDPPEDRNLVLGGIELSLAK